MNSCSHTLPNVLVCEVTAASLHLVTSWLLFWCALSHLALSMFTSLCSNLNIPTHLRKDPQTFGQIRARWESAQQAEDHAPDMVGRKEKHLVQQPVNSEPQLDTGSRFRRKISHGLAFISNPLSQRKTTPKRHEMKAPLLSVSTPTTLEDLTAPREDHSHDSPTRSSISFHHPHDSSTTLKSPTNNPSTTRESPDPNATPRPLPRSQTLSFIPRPVRGESRSSSTAIESFAKPDMPIIVNDAMARTTPTKMPTPSPSLLGLRRVSPRQYLSLQTQQQPNLKAASASVKTHNGSPIKVSIRSRTTPNLTKSVGIKQPTSLRPPVKAGLQRPFVLPGKLKAAQQENVPVKSIVTQRRTEIQERTLKRESLAVAGTMVNRKPFEPGTLLEQRKHQNIVTSQTTRKRLSSNLAQQTPLTAERITSGGYPISSALALAQSISDTSVPQTRLWGPKNPPTPTLLAADASLSILPRSSTDEDVQRKTLGTPNSVGGIWWSSCASAKANHEVSKLPRSRTFHNFGKYKEDPPPVPPIPEQYRAVSLSNLTQYLRTSTNTALKPRHQRMVSDTISCESIPEEIDEDDDGCEKESSFSRSDRNAAYSLKLADSAETLTAPPMIVPVIRSVTPEPAKDLEKRKLAKITPRPWSISRYHFPDSADVASYLQVKDYMPPLYWAGRFQSRYDRWRTDAMAAELDPEQQQIGSLAELKLNQEKLACCYIFAQLRDLCTSNQAADSLWEFEFKYRKENKLLGHPLDLPAMSLRKYEDQTTTRGAFGRAVRKLTPRKASFVNLLKGKGWSKDEEKSNDASEYAMETSSGST